MAAKLGAQAAHFRGAGATFDPFAGIAELSRRAIHYHQAGNLAEAENFYRKILAIDPTHFDSLHLLGVAAHQSGRSALAENLINRAIVSSGRGLDDGKVGTGLGAHSRKQAVGPSGLAEAHSNLSIVLMSLDRPTEALRAIQRSLQLAETENTKLLFVQCVQGLNSISGDAGLRDNLARALSEPWGRPVYLGRLAANVIKGEGKTAAHIRGFAVASRECRSQQDLIDPIELADICRDRLLLTLLETTVVFDFDLERYLTAVRRAMLAIACRGVEIQEQDTKILRFFCALARQCFINEFAFVCSNQEQELTSRLRSLVADALASGAPIAELCLVAIAAYSPLASLPAANLLTQRRWSDPVGQLIAVQVCEVDQELRLRTSVPRLTAVGQGVSLAVKQQYEVNPYPRWVKASPVGQSTTISVRLRAQFPLIDLGTLPTTEAAEILIAGCGTGQHSIETARQFEEARVLAVDLSLTSLCYAMRKTRELGLRNIEYAQADILQLDTLGRSFDVIEASGVLHHLAEPMVGWRVLLSILRPGGFMRLGLYSKAARRDLAPVRTFIAQRGYGSSPAEIRSCRQEVMDAGPNTGLARVADWEDFFSISTCRDLLFHVQEHQLTLPEIGAFLQHHRLQFLGFILPGATQVSFGRRFPGDVAMTNLENWHIFETENPTTFTGMYEFWIRKPV